MFLNELKLEDRTVNIENIMHITPPIEMERQSNASQSDVMVLCVFCSVFGIWYA